MQKRALLIFVLDYLRYNGEIGDVVVGRIIEVGWWTRRGVTGGTVVWCVSSGAAEEVESGH